MIRILDLLPWKRHERWHRDVAALIDGELAMAEAKRLRVHLAGCEACREYDRDLRSLRVALSSMREAESPRSFRLTPAMVATPARAPVRERDGGVVLRGAQFATALAVVALAVVSVVDFSDAGTKRSADATTSLAAAAPESAKSAPNAGAAAGAGFGSAPQDAHAPQPAGTTAPPATPVSGGVAIPTPRGPNSAGSGCDAAQPLGPGSPGATSSSPTPCPSADDSGVVPTSKAVGTTPAETPTAGAPPPSSPQREETATGEPAIASITGATTTSKASWYRPAEVGLGVVAAIAAVAVIVLSFRSRRS